MEIDVRLNTSTADDQDRQCPQIDPATISFRYRLTNNEKKIKPKGRGEWVGSSSIRKTFRNNHVMDSQATFREKTDFEIKTNPVNYEHPLVKSFKKYRLQKLVTIFAQKLKRNAILNKPANLLETRNVQRTFLDRVFGETDGIDMNNFWVIAMEAAGLIISTWLVLIYSLVLVFRSVSSTDIFRLTQSLALIYFLAEVLLNFFVKCYNQGKILSEIRHIIVHYVRKNFLLDFAYFTLIIVDVSNLAEQTMTYLRMIVLLRFTANLKMIDKLQTMICTTFRREQQWGLVLLIIVNFMFAHVLSICLNSMTFLSEENWWTKNSLVYEDWYVKYIYGYYWGINIMLTVGFGDLVATNWKEAMCLVFIEITSCILFTYNINCVGNLFNNLRLQSKEKEKNIKTFRRMCMESNKSVWSTGDLQSRINNFIEKSFEIKNTYNLKGQEETLSILPEKLRNEFKKRVNTKLMENLTFFKDLNRKSLQQLALNITKRIIIPEQIIIKRGDQSKFYLLYPGEVAYIIHEQKRGKQQAVIVEKLPAHKQAQMISFKTFMRRQAQKFNIMATQYSVLYSLDYQTLRSILKLNRNDYEKFCQIRDSSNIQISQGIQCQYCPKYMNDHASFECPRQHYFPLRELICLKYESTCRYQNRQCCKRLRERFPNIVDEKMEHSIKPITNANEEMFLGSGQSLNRSVAFIEDERGDKLADCQADKMYSWKNYFPSENVMNMIRKFNNC